MFCQIPVFVLVPHSTDGVKWRIQLLLLKSKM